MTMKMVIFYLLIISVYWGKELPGRFDLRKDLSKNAVSSVKSQLGGTCWTHGTMASIESNLMINGIWEEKENSYEANLSEYHLDWWNGFNTFYNNDYPDGNQGLTIHEGGDYLVSSAYVSRGDGPVRDEDGQIFHIAPVKKNSSYHFYYPQDIEWFTIGEDLSGIENIKETIMTNGAIGTCMAYFNHLLDSEFCHYQDMASSLLPNHAVTIIGWDDDKETAAAKPGAWLCKNSWGENWGSNGYFWISYYDKYCCREPEMGAVAFKNTTASFFDSVYYHDFHGWRDTYPCNSVFNKFTATGNHIIKGISFFTAADSVEFTGAIYLDYHDGNLENLAGYKNGTISKAGFHSISLDMDVPVRKGDVFYIYLSLSHGGQAFDRTSVVPVLLGSYTLNTIVPSISEIDQSFYLNENEWKDVFLNPIDDQYAGTENFCVKALVEYTDIHVKIDSMDVNYYQTNQIPVIVNHFNEVDSFLIVIHCPEDKINIHNILQKDIYQEYNFSYFFENSKLSVSYQGEKKLNILEDTLFFIEADFSDIIGDIEFDEEMSFVRGDYHEISETYFHSGYLHLIYREPFMKLTHSLRKGQVSIFNNGSIGKDQKDLSSPGFLWSENDGIYCGGLIFGSSERKLVNGTMKSFSSIAPRLITDLMNQKGEFTYGFSRDEQFCQIAKAVICDSSAVNPYNVTVIQQSYSNTEEDLFYVGYSFINQNQTKLKKFSAGLFVDWDVQVSSKNDGGFDLERNLVYTVNESHNQYFGVVALSGLNGMKMSDEFKTLGNEEGVRKFSYLGISQVDTSLSKASGTDVRTWIGTFLGDIDTKDTISVYYAFLADESLEKIKDKAEIAMLKAKELGWDKVKTGIEEYEETKEELIFEQYPNPFHEILYLKFYLPNPSDVSISIYNLLGERVKDIQIPFAEKGWNTAQWNPEKLSSGIYLIKMRLDHEHQIKKVMYLK